MVYSNRLMNEKMEEEDLLFPLHTGVTEAGDGEEGRIRSAVGIGTLLGEGLGDTIRVSLTEEPELEIPVARSSALLEGSAVAKLEKEIINPCMVPSRPTRVETLAIICK